MKNIIFTGLLCASILSVCDAKEPQTIKQDKSELNTIKSVTEVSIFPVHPLDEIDVNEYLKDKYFNKGYEVLGSKIFEGEAIPTGIILLTKFTDGCDRCQAPIVSVACQYLSNKDNNKRWKIIKETDLGEYFGAQGEAPKPVFVKLGDKTHGFSIINRGISWGIFYSSISLYKFENNEPKFLMDFDSHKSNYGEVGEDSPDFYETSSELSFIVEPNKSFYDIKKRTKEIKGAQKSKKRTVKNSESIYRFNGKEYIEVSK